MHRREPHHEAGYGEVFRPAPWYVCTAICVGVLLGVPAVVFLDAPMIVLALMPLLVPVALTQMRVRIDSSGVEYMGEARRWGELHSRETVFGQALVPHGMSGLRGFRVSLYPGMYERGWRHGRIGDLIRLHAPHLLDGGTETT